MTTKLLEIEARLKAADQLGGLPAYLDHAPTDIAELIQAVREAEEFVNFLAYEKCTCVNRPELNQKITCCACRARSWREKWGSR